MLLTCLLYARYQARALEMLEQRHLTTTPIDLQPYVTAADRHANPKRPAALQLDAYECPPAVRRMRSLLLDAGPALQVLNLCLFPSLDHSLPTFSADLVTLPGGSLIALDCQPNGFPLDESSRGGKALAAAYARHRPRLPDGGDIPEAARKYFSPAFLWSRLPSDVGEDRLHELLEPAFDDYFSAYLDMLEDARALSSPAELQIARDAQLDYAIYRLTRDPARPMLTGLFGTEYTESLLSEVLFELPKLLGVEVSVGVDARKGD